MKCWCLVFILSCSAVAFCSPISGVTRVQDWLTLRTKLQIVSAPPSGYVSGLGTIRHVSSRRNLTPEWFTCPANRYYMQVNLERNLNEAQFRFVQVEGHLGYFQHHCGPVFVQPNGGSQTPGENTYVVVNTANTAASLFFLDEESKKIVHRGGRWMRPERGYAFPNYETTAQFQTIDDDSGRFIFDLVDSDESAYPAPTLSGKWEIVFSVSSPISDHTYEVDYKVGMSMIKQTSVIHSWKVSAGTSYEWYKNNVELKYMAEISESVSWFGELERQYTIKVSRGVSSTTWQWVFEAERFGEVYRFRTNILADTSDINSPPQI